MAGERGEAVEGYEIHHGDTRASPPLHPWLMDGARALGLADGPHWGCYLHGVLRNDGLRAAWLLYLGLRGGAQRWHGEVDRQLDRLANTVQECIDVDAVFGRALLGAP